MKKSGRPRKRQHDKTLTTTKNLIAAAIKVWELRQRDGGKPT